MQVQGQVSGPTVISSKKLLRSAAVARTIPGLGTQRTSSLKKPSRSTKIANRFGLHALKPPSESPEKKQGADQEFFFPETAPHRRIQLLEDTCANLILALISFGMVHLCTMTDSWEANGIRSASSLVTRHLLASDLGLVLVWGVLVTLFRELFGRAQSSDEKNHSEWRMEFEAITLTGLIIAMAVPLSGVGLATSTMLLGVAVLNVAGSFGRIARKHRTGRSRCTLAQGAKNVLIAGANDVGQQIADYLEQHKEHGRIVRGLLDHNRKLDARVLGGIDDLPEIARAEFIDEIIIAQPQDRAAVRVAIIEAVRNHLDIRIVADHFVTCISEGPEPIPILPLHEEPIPEFGLLAKRALDVALSSVGLIILAPLLTLIALAIWLDSGGPVLYRAPRIGKKGLKFLCCKFRTMVADADKFKEALRDQNERRGPIFKIENDPRITRVGHFLRRYSLDELPQLWNVLLGEMSLVGPRPHPLDDYRRYGLQHLRRLDVTPGITGLWQVTARRDPSFYKNMELDLEYIDQWSLWMDLKILIRTLRVVFAGTGV